MEGREQDEPQGGDSPPRQPGRVMSGMVATAAWLYVALLLGVWATMYLAGDRWWIATIMLFGPRWVWALPLGVLIPAAMILCRRSLGILLIGAVIAAWPVMDLCIPWHRVLHDSADGLRIRVLTCNIHIGALRGPALGDLIASTNPDVIALQEWTPRHHPAVFGGGRWHILRDGELCLGSRYPIRKVKDLLERRASGGVATCYEMKTPKGSVYLINLHLGSPHVAFNAVIDGEATADSQVEDNCALRWKQSELVRQYVDQLKGPVLLAGDFNTVADSPISRQFWSGLTNAFSAGGLGLGYTYRAHQSCIRIDHILGSAGWQCRTAWVGPDVGSPHRPLIADMQWIGPQGR